MTYFVSGLKLSEFITATGNLSSLFLKKNVFEFINRMDHAFSAVQHSQAVRTYWAQLANWVSNNLCIRQIIITNTNKAFAQFAVCFNKIKAAYPTNFAIMTYTGHLV